MYKKLIMLIVGILVMVCAIVININNTDKAEPLTSNNPSDSKNQDISFSVDLDTDEANEVGYCKVAENDILELYLNNENLGLRIINKATGYVWNSTFDTEDKNLNETWQAFAKSAVTIEYIDDKNKVRRVSLTSENTKTKITKAEAGFKADIVFSQLNIKLTLEIDLENDSIVAKIPFASIEEKSDTNKIQTIILYPFLGAVKGNDMSGYMFVPDGSGALISLNQKTNATQPYVGRVYGGDLGITGVPRWTEGNNSLETKQVSMPVFGINHNYQNSFVADIESGELYAEISAYPAGVTTDFNWTTTKFIYREAYLQPIDKKGNAITVNQKDKNIFDVAVRYMFLSNESSSYIGMARRYQKRLVESGILKKTISKDNKNIPLRLEFVMADNKKQLLWHEIIAVTTVSQMDGILNDLINNNINNMKVVISGWTKGGITGSSPSYFPFEKKVGTKNEWMSFIKKYEDKDIPIYMYTDFVKAYNSAEEYGKNDIAQSISKQLISFGDYYYLNPNSTSKIFVNQLSRFEANGISNIALGTMGNNLMSSFNPKTTLNRNEAIKIYGDMLMQRDKNNYAFYKPNQYMWKYTNEYFDIPMDSSGFMLETETVPFLQIVLKGYVEYYAQASNFHSNKVNETLKLIDYGAMPSYYLTYNDPVQLLDTGTEWLYTSQYSLWKNEIVKSYETVNKALKLVRDAVLDDRIVLKEGVIKNVYSNGVSIIINYTKQNFKDDKVSVLAEDFAVTRGY